MRNLKFASCAAALALALTGSSFAQSAGDGCAAATNITGSITVDGPTLVTTLTDITGFSAATDGIQFPCGFSGIPEANSKGWYVINSASLPAFTEITITTDGSTTPDGGIGANDTALQVSTGACGGPFTSVQCSDDRMADLLSEVTFTTDGTSTYFVCVGHYNDSDGMGQPWIVRINVTAVGGVAPPANDTCANRESIDNSSFPIAATWDGAANTIALGPYAGVDVWYEFTATVNGGYEFTLTPLDAAADPAIFLLGFSPCTALVADPEAFQTDVGFGGDPEVMTRTMHSGDIYIFLLKLFDAGTAGDFNFTLVVTPGAEVQGWDAY